MKFKILLYYKYIPLVDPSAVLIWQRQLCEKFDLKGRIIIAGEGINGTVAGLTKNVNAYTKATASRPEFADLDWKVSWTTSQVFPKLKIVLRDELVTSNTQVLLQHKADYIQPKELAKLYDLNQDFVIVDARNNYEAEIGKFKNAIVPPIDNFRDFPKFVKKNLVQFKHKQIITYCTGGVRCEKASAYLREQGFTNVKQLHGGIHEYGEKAGGKYFEGEMFVFDQRLHVPINKINPTILTKCLYCSTPVTRYIDCIVGHCDQLFNCCKMCEKKHHTACPDHFHQIQTKEIIALAPGLLG